MSSPDELHPDLKTIARVLPRSIFTRRTLPLVTALSRAPGFRERSDIDVHRLNDGASVRLHRPSSGELTNATLLWIHGGGYVMGSAAQDDDLCSRFARKLGITVASVEYRLAPKDPYPAGLEDCYTALQWLAGQPEVDPSRIAIGGASAGGGLAAALAILARDRAEVIPCHQLLVYPMVDAPTSDHQRDHPNSRVWSHRTNRLSWELYLSGADPDSVAPARHHDLSNLPPAWLGVGTLDPLHHEGVAYARRLHAAGVACQLEEIPGAFHGFDQFLPGSRVSRDFFRSQARALASAFATA